jgi:hypothetical protein
MRERRGVKPHPDSQAWRDVPGAGQPWTDEDDAIIMRLDPAAATQRLGRTVTAVYIRHWEIGRAKVAGGRGR